jgi:hypothetical protein
MVLIELVRAAILYSRSMGLSTTDQREEVSEMGGTRLLLLFGGDHLSFLALVLIVTGLHFQAAVANGLFGRLSARLGGRRSDFLLGILFLRARTTTIVVIIIAL